ncbi:MAG: hypothetical protein AB8C84_01040 [Oligoflexales bacterium]
MFIKWVLLSTTLFTSSLHARPTINKESKYYKVLISATHIRSYPSSAGASIKFVPKGTILSRRPEPIRNQWWLPIFPSGWADLRFLQEK